MSKKRTRAQKLKLDEHRQAIARRLEAAKKVTVVAPAALQTAFVPKDFRRTLISTLIVLGVLILIYVYTRMSF